MDCCGGHSGQHSENQDSPEKRKVSFDCDNNIDYYWITDFQRLIIK